VNAVKLEIQKEISSFPDDQLEYLLTVIQNLKNKSRQTTIDSLFGSLHQYADPDKVSGEHDAFVKIMSKKI